MFIRSLTIFIMMKDHLYYLHVLKNIWMKKHFDSFCHFKFKRTSHNFSPRRKGELLQKVQM